MVDRAAGGNAPQRRSVTLASMRIELTTEAETILRKKGGVMTVDYIRPTG